MVKNFKYFFVLVFLKLPMDVKPQYMTVPEDSYKFAITASVVKKVAEAFADPRPHPRLEMISNKDHTKKVAVVKPYPVPVLIIDEKIYDLCVSFGADSLNALASIVGHELAHFYRDHHAIDGFAGFTETEETVETSAWISANRKASLEAEADYFGTYYAFQAGFDPFDVLPKVLLKIYQEYEFPDQLEGYPAKDEISDKYPRLSY